MQRKSKIFVAKETQGISVDLKPSFKHLKTLFLNNKRGGLLKSLILSSVLLLICAFIASAVSEPKGPSTLIVTKNETRSQDESPWQINAAAGNVSELLITQVRVTEAWQGYYGNITGTIVLDDADDYTLYDWSLPNPTGEVYASNGSSVTWADINCFNLTNQSTGGGAGWWNVTTVETDFNITEVDLDGLDETFNTTYVNTTGFTVGGILINNEDECAQANTYVDEAHQVGRFREVLLTDNNSLIFTTILENSVDGYQTGTDPHDFQMLVLEDGHPGQESSTTPYYFYVELS